MAISLRKLWNDYGIAGVLFAIVLLYVLYMLYNYMASKGRAGSEKLSSNTNSAYRQQQQSSGAVQPSQPLGQNEMFSDVNEPTSSGQGIPSSCNKGQLQNPNDLLPKDTNSQCAQLNPSGKGELANINLLKAGYNIGIDTIGQSLRNANLQERSEPPNPQMNVGPWNLSTITPDFLRIPLEIGQGTQ